MFSRMTRLQKKCIFFRSKLVDGTEVIQEIHAKPKTSLATGPSSGMMGQNLDLNANKPGLEPPSQGISLCRVNYRIYFLLLETRPVLDRFHDSFKVNALCSMHAEARGNKIFFFDFLWLCWQFLRLFRQFFTAFFVLHSMQYKFRLRSTKLWLPFLGGGCKSLS